MHINHIHPSATSLVLSSTKLPLVIHQNDLPFEISLCPFLLPTLKFYDLHGHLPNWKRSFFGAGIVSSSLEHHFQRPEQHLVHRKSLQLFYDEMPRGLIWSGLSATVQAVRSGRSSQETCPQSGSSRLRKIKRDELTLRVMETRDCNSSVGILARPETP